MCIFLKKELYGTVACMFSSRSRSGCPSESFSARAEGPFKADLRKESGGISSLTASKWPAMRVAQASGIPTIHLDNKPWFGMAANRPYFGNHLEIFERLASAGLKHFHFDATCSEDLYHPELCFWKGPNSFDPSAQEDYFKKLVSICPDALFTLRVGVYAPSWWLDAHPGECQMYVDGRCQIELQRAGIRRLPSLASTLWQQAANHALRKYVEWLMQSGWSKRVCALFLSNGITWEWGLLGTDGLIDYSAPGVAYFRRFVRKKYQTEQSLSKAWGKTRSFDDIEVPGAEERLQSFGPAGLRPTPEYQHVIDHQQSLSAMNADFLLSLAATTKKVSDGQALVGAFYGYTLTGREQSEFTGRFGAGGFFGGHHELSSVLQSPDIDFLASPFHYANRSLGSGLLLEHVPLASVFAHGKAFWDENDIWAHNNPPGPGALPSVMSVGYTSTPKKTLLNYRRAWASAIVRGKHQWLTELTGWIGDFRENFSDSVLLDEIRRMNSISGDLIQRKRSSVVEVAYVLDEKSIAHLSSDHKDFLSKVYHRTVVWAQLGTPFDVILLDDLLASSEHYRLIIPACIKQAAAIDRLSAWQKKGLSNVLWDGTNLWYPPEDISTLLQAYEDSGVHRYMEQGTVWANSSMVMTHVDLPGEYTIRFRQPCTGIEFFSDQPFSTQSGVLKWTFEEAGVALFLTTS
jgi:hypothetical protein